jgi:hypothetical protein
LQGDLALLKLKAPVEITAAALISEKNFEEVAASGSFSTLDRDRYVILIIDTDTR